MQTADLRTPRSDCREGNLVDLTEYRAARGLPVPEPERKAPPARPRAVRRRPVHTGMALDWAASAALILTALIFIIKIL